jgi:hypothetical protein
MPCVFFVRWSPNWIGQIEFDDFKKDFVGEVVDGDPWTYLACTATTQ